METRTVATAGLLEQLAREIHAETSLAGLSASQWAVLRYLAKAGRSACTAQQISCYLGDSEILVLRSLTALARRTLVMFSVDALGEPVSLTDRGRQTLANDPMSRLAAAVSAIPTTDQQELARLVESIYDRLVRPTALSS